VASLMAIWAMALTAFAPNGFAIADADGAITVAQSGAQEKPFIERGTAALTQAQGPVPSCPTERIELTPLSAGRSQIAIQSDCRKSEPVRIQYAGAEFVARIDQNGRLLFVLDCFAGDAPEISFIFADGTQDRKRAVALDLDRVTKLAVIWTAPVNLDLHAFEYSALPQSPDHIWSGAPLTENDARLKIGRTKRGHGYLSSASDGTGPGSKLEVYTLFHAPREPRGVISMALDYESRARPEHSPDTCGTGLYAELEYEAILLERQKPPVRLFRKFSSLDCEAKLSGIDRLNHKTVPEIIIKNN
jgi:hypothetical protein